MHELSFEWNFGDPGSGTWAISGQSKNFATGPAAAHVFKTPGTYQVVLEARDASGLSNTNTVTITVDDPNTIFSGTKTICFAPDGVFTGAPAGALLITTSSLDVVMGHLASTRRLLLKRGASFATTGIGFNIQTNGPGIIGSFGPASAPPRVTGSSTYFRLKSLDWRILDLEFQGPGIVGNAAIEATDASQDSLVMNTRAVPGTLHRMFSGSVTAPDKMFIVENDWRDFGLGTTGSGGNIIFTLAKRLALLGNHLEDARDGEHIVRLAQCQKGVVSHNYFAKPRITKSLLTLRSSNGGEAHEIIVSDNVFVSHGDQHLGVVEKNDSTHTVSGRDFIIERNFFKGDPTSGRAASQAIGLYDADKVTIRNNVFLFNSWGYRGIGIQTTDEVWIYNNSFYSADSSTTVARLSESFSGTNHIVKNNLWYAPGITNANALVTNATVQSNNIKATSNPYGATTITDAAHFSLHSTSVALNAGASVPVFEDYDLNPRTPGPTTDVGAFEYVTVSNLVSHGTFESTQATVLQDMTNPFTLGTGAANIWQGRVGALGSQTTTYMDNGAGNHYVTVGTSTNGPGAFQVIAWPGAGTKQVSYSYKGTSSKVRIYRGTTGNTINKFDGTNNLILIQEFTNPSATTWTSATQNVTLSGTYDYLVIQLRAGDFDNVSITP
jgi:hypothetical protein